MTVTAASAHIRLASETQPTPKNSMPLPLLTLSGTHWQDLDPRTVP